MNRDEKLCQMQLLKNFCTESGIDSGELQFLFNELAFESQGSKYDIYYADGTISHKLDLSKEALAAKISYHSGSFWASLKTIFSQKLNLRDAE